MRGTQVRRNASAPAGPPGPPSAHGRVVAVVAEVGRDEARGSAWWRRSPDRRPAGFSGTSPAAQRAGCVDDRAARPRRGRRATRSAGLRRASASLPLPGATKALASRACQPSGPRNGSLVVKTYREGVAAKVGHDLVIEVTRLGRRAIDGDAASSSRADPRSLQRARGRARRQAAHRQGPRRRSVKTIDDEDPAAASRSRSAHRRRAGGGRLASTGDLTIAGTHAAGRRSSWTSARTAASRAHDPARAERAGASSPTAG